MSSTDQGGGIVTGCAHLSSVVTNASWPRSVITICRTRLRMHTSPSMAGQKSYLIITGHFPFARHAREHDAVFKVAS